MMVSLHSLWPAAPARLGTVADAVSAGLGGQLQSSGV